jgi:hypothetical protein
MAKPFESLALPCRALATPNETNRIDFQQNGDRAAFRLGFWIEDLRFAEGQFFRLESRRNSCATGIPGPLQACGS